MRWSPPARPQMLTALWWYTESVSHHQYLHTEAFTRLNEGPQPWHEIMVLVKLSAVSLGHTVTDPKIKRSAYAAKKCCWQAPVMNWWAIFSCDLSSAAGGEPQRGQSDNFRWGPGAGGTSQAGQRTFTGPPPALWSGSSRMADGGLQSRSCVPTARSGHSRGINHLGFESSWIIWLLSLQVPPVNSKLGLPDGRAENTQYVPVNPHRLGPATNRRARMEGRYRAGASAAVL